MHASRYLCKQAHHLQLNRTNWRSLSANTTSISTKIRLFVSRLPCCEKETQLNLLDSTLICIRHLCPLLEDPRVQTYTCMCIQIYESTYSYVYLNLRKQVPAHQKMMQHAAIHTATHAATHTATHTAMQVQEHQKLMQHIATHTTTHTATHSKTHGNAH